MHSKERLRVMLGETESCLSLEQLEKFLEKSAGQGWAAGSAGDSHLASCPRCSTELSLLREFRSMTPRTEEAEAVEWIAARLEERSPVRAVRRPEREVRFPWWKHILSPGWVGTASWAAAMVLVVIAAGIYFQGAREPVLPKGAGAGPQVFRSDQVELLAPMGDLEQAPAELRWRPAPGASRYQVRLMEVDRTEIWNGDSVTTSIVLPADVQARVLPRKTLLWQVIAWSDAGARIAASEIQRFRLTTGRSR